MWRTTAGRGKGEPGERAGLVAELAEEGLVPPSRAGHAGEVRLVVVDGPVVFPVRAIAGRVDRGEAAPATVDYVTGCGEREGGQPEAGLGGRREQAERRVAVVGERPDAGPP